MVNLLIDAPLLACPTEDLEGEEFNNAFLNFVSALVDLSRFRRSISGVVVWREATLTSTLHVINAYPFRHVLDKAIQRLDPSLGFQVDMISGLATALLSKSSCLNDIVDIEDVVIKGGELEGDPVQRRCVEMMKYICRSTEFALAHFGEEEFYPGVKILSQSPSCGNVESRLSYDIEMVGYRDGVIDESDKRRDLKLSFFEGSESNFSCLDSLAIWCGAKDSNLLDAIAILAVQSKSIEYEGVLSFKEKIRFCASFISTCERLGFLHEPGKIKKLLSACVDICVGRNLNKSHWLRAGMGAKEPQRKKLDSYYAWRHDIDDEFHLHYWRRGSFIEFANVVVHNDFNIDD